MPPLSYANNFRGGLARIARFKRLCSPDRICLEEAGDKVSITIEWPVATEPAPPLSVDANFALLVELGRMGAPDIDIVARDLGVSQRTLQRRITAEGRTFRVLLTDARKEMSLRLLADPAIDIKEIAYLLGYDDAKSFYRVFRQWEGVTRVQWRRGRR